MMKKMKKFKILLFLVFALAVLIIFVACDSCDHEYDTTSAGPLCEEEVVNSRTCIKCGEKTDTAIPPRGHDFKVTVKAATCTTSGYTEFMCDCGYSYHGDIKSATGHDYSVKVINPTCNDFGYTEYTCKNCGDSYTGNFIDALGHNLTSVTIAPDCTNEGYTSYTCSRCDYSFASSFVEPLGHEFESITTDPNCMSAGFIQYLCVNCDYYYISDFTPPLGHYLEGVVTNPDCINVGFTTYTCENCDYSYTSDFLSPLGHSYTSITLKGANCTEEGEEKYSCECGYEYTVTIAPLGHNFTKSVVAPTVSDMGYTEFACECGFNYIGNYRFYSEILDNAYAGSNEVLAQGIDISRWNHQVDSNGEYIPIDWEALKAAGVDYVILKVGSTIREGDTLGGLEPTFEMDYQGAKAAGLDVGVYFFTYSTNVRQIKKDAEYLLTYLDGKEFEYPIYLDLEEAPKENYYPGEIASPILTEMCLSFFSILQAEGYYTGLYVNNEFLYNILQTENMIDLFEIWYARYPNLEPYDWSIDETMEYPFGDAFGMWQYTMTGKISTLVGDVDFNYAYKDLPSLIKQNGFNGLNSADQE